eukprot:12912843-Alexandrium_andersonii.AAC.1
MASCVKPVPRHRPHYLRTSPDCRSTFPPSRVGVALADTPTLVAVSETFLDRGSRVSTLSGFTVVARRDRGAPGGGVL